MAIELIAIDCPLCGGVNEKLFSLGSSIYPVNISICRNCGFVFQNPRFNKEQWEAYYLSDYDLCHRPTSRQCSTQEECTSGNKNARDIYERITGTLGQCDPEKCLDIGCGDGDILYELQRACNFGRSHFAIEPSEKYREQLKTKGIVIIGSSLDNIDCKYIGAVDFIVMRHVLEHIYDPVSDLKKIVNKLLRKDTGYIYIAVPNLRINDPLAGFYFPHISYFSSETLRDCCLAAGLSVVKIAEESGEVWGLFNWTDSARLPRQISCGENYSTTKQFIRENLNAYALIRRSLMRLISGLLPSNFVRRLLAARNK